MVFLIVRCSFFYAVTLRQMNGKRSGKKWGSLRGVLIIINKDYSIFEFILYCGEQLRTSIFGFIWGFPKVMGTLLGVTGVPPPYCGKRPERDISFRCSLLGIRETWRSAAKSPSTSKFR